MRPFVDHTECIGCGQCEQLCPEVFELREGGVAYIMSDESTGKLKDAIDETIEDCPVAAVSWVE